MPMEINCCNDILGEQNPFQEKITFFDIPRNNAKCLKKIPTADRGAWQRANRSYSVKAYLG